MKFNENTTLDKMHKKLILWCTDMILTYEIKCNHSYVVPFFDPWISVNNRDPFLPWNMHPGPILQMNFHKHMKIPRYFPVDSDPKLRVIATNFAHATTAHLSWHVQKL